MGLPVPVYWDMRLVDLIAMSISCREIKLKGDNPTLKLNQKYNEPGAEAKISDGNIEPGYYYRQQQCGYQQTRHRR